MDPPRTRIYEHARSLQNTEHKRTFARSIKATQCLSVAPFDRYWIFLFPFSLDALASEAIEVPTSLAFHPPSHATNVPLAPAPVRPGPGFCSPNSQHTHAACTNRWWWCARMPRAPSVVGARRAYPLNSSSRHPLILLASNIVCGTYSEGLKAVTHAAHPLTHGTFHCTVPRRTVVCCAAPYCNALCRVACCALLTVVADMEPHQGSVECS